MATVTVHNIGICAVKYSHRIDRAASILQCLRVRNGAIGHTDAKGIACGRNTVCEHDDDSVSAGRRSAHDRHGIGHARLRVRRA